MIAQLGKEGGGVNFEFSDCGLMICNRRILSWPILTLLVFLASTNSVEAKLARWIIYDSLSGSHLKRLNSLYRFIELPEQQHCQDSFKCTLSDNRTNVTWKQKNCVDESIRDNRVSFIFNLALVFIVGLVGNTLTLAAFPYAWIYYRNSFPGVLTLTVTKTIATITTTLLTSSPPSLPRCPARLLSSSSTLHSAISSIVSSGCPIRCQSTPIVTSSKNDV